MLSFVVVAVVSLACPFPIVGALSPVAGVVTHHYVEPACDRCGGRRGVTVATREGSHVRATRLGAVTFAGQVGGALWVVQEVAPGVRVTYGRLARLAEGVESGVVLGAGDSVGAAGPSTYLGVRVGDRPRNPARCWVRVPRLVATNVGRSRQPR